MKITFYFDPTHAPTAQQKGVRVVNGVPMFYKKKPLQDFETAFTKAVDKARRENGNYRIPDGVAIYCHITFLFPYPHGVPKARRVDMAPMTQRPDGDNLVKAVIDCLGDRFKKQDNSWVLAHEGVFRDDSAITSYVISKFRTTGVPRICVNVMPRAEWVKGSEWDREGFGRG